MQIGRIEFGPEKTMWLPAVKRDSNGRSFICPECAVSWIILALIAVAAYQYLKSRVGT